MESECAAVAQALYALPDLANASAAYGLGFALVFVPWLTAWAAGQLRRSVTRALHH